MATADLEPIDKSLVKILRAKSKGTVAIFERGDIYSCYEDDARLLAGDVFLSDVGLRSFSLGSTMRLTYFNMNHHRYLRALRELLLVLRYRVEQYTVVDDDWRVQAKGSLGNLGDFEELLSDCVELSELATVMCTEIVSDATRKEDLRFTYAEFVDSEHLAYFECLVALCPRECVVLEGDLANDLSRTSTINSSCNSTMNASRTAVSRLVTGVDATLIRGNVTRAEINASPLEIAQMQMLIMDGEKNDISQFSLCVQRCLCAPAGHMQLGDDGGANYNGRFELTRYASAGYMHLDAAAVRALELFSVNYDDRDNVALSTDASSPQTLFDALNKCRSLPGQRLLRDWLRRPLADARRIAERQDVVRALGVVHTARCTMHEDLLRRVPDLPALARKLVQKKAGLQDCYRMYQAVRLIDRFDSILTDVFNHVDCVDTAPAIRELLLEPLRVCAAQFARFTHLIETTIDVGQGDKTGVFRIRPEVDANLLEVSRRMKAVEKEAKKLLDGIATKMDSDQVSVDHNDQHGYFFRVTFKEEKTVRRLGFTVLDTNKGTGVRFSTKQLDAVNAEHREMQAEYNDAQSSLIRAVLDTCAGYVAPLHQLSTVFAMMDVLVSFAMLANAASSSLTYVQPEILDKNARVLELVQCRHPVLELLPDMHFVPNDVMLGKEAGSGKRFLVITGANMGGKSTLLRATALSVLLGQIGAPVPCTSARFSVVDGIHARVGASDFQFKGMSTFMAEMVESAAILETATENSLVIVDELGRGTSTYDGFGLAYAIAEYLLQRVGCFVLFATHFHEMAALARPESDPEGRVLCVRAETQIAPGTGDVILLFRFREGVAERSFGVQCAQLVGFPQKIIESANRLLDLLSGDCSNNSPSSNKENEDEAMESGDDDSEMRAIEVLKRLRAIPGDQLRRAILM